MGFPFSGPLEEAVKEVAPDIRSYFISDEGPYLRVVSSRNVQYLGKFAGDSSDLTKLKLLKTNILSILNKLCPNLKVSGEEILLISLEAENHE